tara:strand:+ start:547 stop:774 length:228 start_codon:yes stop_codon:yes gene_type:complete
MKRLLLPLLAALALPTAVNAENYYLLVSFGERNFTVPMKSLDQCEEQLAIVTNTDNWKVTRVNTKKVGGICIEGK